MSKEVFVVERRKDRTGWWTILLAGCLIAFHKEIIIGALFAGIAFAMYKLYLQQKAYNANRRADREIIARRADLENAEYLRSGLYEGQYPATTMPISEPWYDHPGSRMPAGEQIIGYKDYDDGLKEWK